MPRSGLQKVQWQSLAPYFGVGVANYGGGFPACAFYKDPMGFVHLRGLLSYAGGAGVTVFTLPAGYRPGSAELFSVLASHPGGQIGFRFDIYQSGAGITQTSSAVAPTGAYLSIDGITFSAEL